MDGRYFEIIQRTFIPILEKGILYSVPLAIISFLIGIVLAVLTALSVINRIPILKQIAAIYIWIFRGTPLLVQLFVIYWGICNPLGINKWIAAVVAFSLNVGSYSAETVRASILAVPKGQWESAYSLGMTYFQAFTWIVLPQAAKIAVPPLFNSFISLVKDTSLASTIMIAEMFRKAQEFASVNFEYFLIYSEVAVIYLIFCTILSSLQKLLELRLRT